MAKDSYRPQNKQIYGSHLHTTQILTVVDEASYDLLVQSPGLIIYSRVVHHEGVVSQSSACGEFVFTSCFKLYILLVCI